MSMGLLSVLKSTMGSPYGSAGLMLMDLRLRGFDRMNSCDAPKVMGNSVTADFEDANRSAMRACCAL